MAENKKTDNSDYQFIREKIASNKKNRFKRVIFIVAGTIVLAVVFGFLARLTFMLSADTVNRIIGISPTFTPTEAVVTKTPIDIPTATSKPTNTPSPVPSPLPSPTSGEEADPTPTPTTEPEPSVTNEAEEIAAYRRMCAALKNIAEKASKYMAEIELVTISQDWFGEPVETVSGTSSGVILGNNGVELLVLVNAGRTEECDRIDVTIGSTKVTDVKVSASSSEYNFAILAVPLEQLAESDLDSVSYASFGDSSELTVGTPLIAIGDPNGYTGSYEITMVSTTGEYEYLTDNRIELYNTSMSENASGDGVLINLSGEIVGIITHDFKNDKNAAMTTMIGINNVKTIICNLANDVAGNYIGLVVKEAPASVLEKLGIENGLYVTEVKEGSPAETAGLQKGDVLISIGDGKLVTVDDYSEYLGTCKTGDSIEFSFIRDGAANTASVTVAESN